MAPQLHNLVHHESKEEQHCWITRKNKRSHIGVSEDKKLELRLGLPGDIDHIIDHHDHHEDKKALLAQSGPKEERINWLPNRSLAFVKEEPKQTSYVLPYINKTPNLSEKRPVRAPVVGWPPIRSFRKNLGSNNSSKTPNASFECSDEKGGLIKDHDQVKVKVTDNINGTKSDINIIEDHMFVKINMEGVPIGRKVDLKAYHSYEKLSYAIDELFRGLLAAQRIGSETNEEISTKDKTVSNGEYTLVYEDNEGDRMLVGDVPWKMFVSTAKRLRVLRTVELSTLKLNSSQIEKTPQ